ncbi:MAG: IRE (iron responsive element), partial [Planctomycetota bacterium]
MNQSTAFRRKIIYLVVLVATLVPLYLLGQPSDGTSDSGGQLATMRQQFDISESDLGEISPASETMKLASLGLRGVAATLLWEKAHRYRVMHEWDRLKASLNQIALLQPHYDKVWEHQAHNLAYNVSVEFDDYRQRYEMVREGTEFLTRGVRQNKKAPRLIWYTGWFYGQKLGMSDEKRQFRKLFADDEVLHEALAKEGIAVYGNEATGPNSKPDNWLVGRLWLYRGYDLVDAGIRIRRQTPLNFFETGPKWSFKHAEAIETEGILDENAEFAWTKASEDWDRFGQRSIPTTSAFTIKLGSIDDLKQKRLDKFELFKELSGNLYEEERQK